MICQKPKQKKQKKQKKTKKIGHNAIYQNEDIHLQNYIN